MLMLAECALRCFTNRMEYTEKIASLRKRHGSEIEQMETSYQKKIEAEAERYEALVKERDHGARRWDEQNVQLVESHEQFVAELAQEYEQKITDLHDDMRTLETEKRDIEDESEHVRGDMEEDADREIEEIKRKYEARLKDENRLKLRFKGENGIMKRKFSALQKDIEDQREEIKSMMEKEKELYEKIDALEGDIQASKKEIREREETIQNKEKRIYDLNKKNRELAKHVS